MGFSRQEHRSGYLPYSRGSSGPTDRMRVSCLSCIGGWTLTWKVHTHTSMPPFLSLPVQVTTGPWVGSRALYSMFSLIVYFVLSVSTAHMSIPTYQFILLSSYSLGVHTFVLYICVCISALQIRSSMPIVFRFHIYASIYTINSCYPLLLISYMDKSWPHVVTEILGIFFFLIFAFSKRENGHQYSIAGPINQDRFG